MALRHPIIFAIILSACHLTLQSPSLFSLQPAVEALNEREVELARDELQSGDYNDNDDFDDYGYERGKHTSNKALARYLSRSNPDYDDYLAYRKRALFRKRGTSVFRERSRLPSQHQQQAQLAEKFLKAIENEREREREEEYRESLRNMWNSYHDEESAIEQELFNDNENNNLESDYPVNYEDLSKKKKKRQRGDIEVAPVYWEDKRSMPLLPWLPASRKKRFPVTKRSPKMNDNELSHSLTTGESTDKVSQDLKGIFGADSDDDKKKKKRSMDEINHGDSAKPGADRQQHASMMAPHHSHDTNINDKKRSIKKRSPPDDFDEDEPDNENDNEEESDDGTDEGSEEDDDDSKKKKKRKREAAKKSLEVMGSESFPEKKAIKKKSVEWSNIFGIDRKRKRSNDIIFHRFESDRKKRMDDDDDEYTDDYEDETERRKKRLNRMILRRFGGDRRKRYPDINDDDDDYEDPEDDYEDLNKKKKRSRNEEKLDAMDRKLKAMKNLIIEDTARYYSHHDENLSPVEVKEMRSELADRLAAAYSLDKMRRAIARLKQSMAFQKSLDRNVLDSQVRGRDEFDSGDDDDKKKAKRVAIKKEKVEFDNNDHKIDSSLTKVDVEEKHNGLSNDDEEKKKKKRSQKKSIMTNDIEEDDERVAGTPMSEGYMGGRVFGENCPLIDAIEKRCRGIDLLSGDSHHNLLEACGAHQLCYLCGDSEAQCDYGYLYEIQDTCGHNSRCKLNGAQALKALRSFSGTKVGPRECVRNPCLNSALRSLGY